LTAADQGYRHAKNKPLAIEANIVTHIHTPYDHITTLFAGEHDESCLDKHVKKCQKASRENLIAGISTMKARHARVYVACKHTDLGYE
jgi:hypothetical protein